MAPAVSVLIPTYDRPRFLAEAIASVLAQDDPDLEVLVGDDGAVGAAVVAAADDPRVRYQRNEPRLGMAGNWQRLLDAAHGELLLLLMDDDRLAPDFVARGRAAFAADPELGVVFSNHTFARPAGDDVRACALAPGRHDHFAAELLRTKPVAISAALIRAAAWRDVRPLPDTAAADIVLFARIADVGWPFFYVDAPLMRYRVHDAMYSSSRAFRDDCVRAWESLELGDRAAREQRDRLLADALLSRAAAELREDDLLAAREDARRAWGLRPSSRVRALGMRIAAADRRLAGAARALAGRR
jgi:glycosyltransferase involved in cell wall biosynthesis